MEVAEVLNDCRSEQLRQLITEHNKAVRFLEAVKRALPDVELPELPLRIVKKK